MTHDISVSRLISLHFRPSAKKKANQSLRHVFWHSFAWLQWRTPTSMSTLWRQVWNLRHNKSFWTILKITTPVGRICRWSNVPAESCPNLVRSEAMPKYANNVMELGQKRSKRFQTHVLYCPIHDFFLSVDKVDCNRATHSSSGRMPHVRWCLGTNLETTWKIRIQNLLCSVWIFLKLSETFSRLASCTAQWFQRQWTLLGPRIRVRCKLHEDHEVATSYILSVIVTVLSTT